MASLPLLSLLLALNLQPDISTPSLAKEQIPPLRFITEHSPPGMYLDEHGNVAGVTAELIRVLQARLNEPGEIELMPWARALETARNQSNIALFETARITEREQWFKWVGPLKLVQTSLYGHASRFAANNPTEVSNGSLIACDYVNSLNISYLQSAGFRENHNLILTNKHGECFSLFIAGKVDLIILNEATAAQVSAQLQKSGNDSLYRINTLRETQLFLAFSLDVSDDRIASWQQALEQSYRDGTMRRLYQSVYSEDAIKRLEDTALNAVPDRQQLLFQLQAPQQLNAE